MGKEPSEKTQIMESLQKTFRKMFRKDKQQSEELKLLNTQILHVFVRPFVFLLLLKTERVLKNQTGCFLAIS